MTRATAPGFSLGLLGRTLIIASAGGAVAAAFGLPLAWMIGAMAATACVSMAGGRLAVPPRARAAMIMVLGILLGSAFRPNMLDQAGGWAITLAALLPYVACGLLIGFVLLRRVGGFDRTTAYFTAAPGGLNEMVLIGGAMGGDERTIALVHSARIMLVVFAVPLWFGTGEGPAASPFGALIDPGGLTLVDALLLALCAIGAPVARLLRVPAGDLVGPMVLSAALHLAGIAEGAPPAGLVAIAQIVVGASIGSRFGGLHPRRLATIFGQAMLLTAALVALDLAFSFVLSRATGLPMTDLALAYAPGGLSEMSLVALALGADAAFVSVHHIVRIVLIVTLAPLVFRMLRPRL